MLDGFEVRDDREWRRTAQIAAWLLAPWSKKRITVDDLLKRRPTRRTVTRPRDPARAATPAP
jgi:hypothetical protein